MTDVSARQHGGILVGGTTAMITGLLLTSEKSALRSGQCAPRDDIVIHCWFFAYVRRSSTRRRDRLPLSPSGEDIGPGPNTTSADAAGLLLPPYVPPLEASTDLASRLRGVDEGRTDQRSLQGRTSTPRTSCVTDASTSCEMSSYRRPLPPNADHSRLENGRCTRA